MKVICNNCNFEILLNKNSKDDFIYNEKQFTLTYFSCNNCDTIYPILIQDEKAKQLSQEFNKLRDEYSKSLDKEKYYEAKNKQKEYCNYLDEIKKIFNNGRFCFATENNKTKEKIIYLT